MIASFIFSKAGRAAILALIVVAALGVAYKRGGDNKEQQIGQQDQETAEDARNAGDNARNETDNLDDNAILDSLRENGGLREDE